jgi:hypothetical protein
VADDKGSNSIGDLAGIFSFLRGMTEAKGVDSKSASSIVKDNPDNGKVNPNLSSSETARITKIATIIGKTLGVGVFAKGPEAARLENLAPNKAISAVKEKVKGIATGLKDQGNIFSLRNILATLGTVAAGILGWSLLPKDIQDKIKDVVGTIYHKVLDVVKNIFKDVDKDKLIKIAGVIGTAFIGILAGVAALDFVLSGLAVAITAVSGSLALFGLALAELAVVGVLSIVGLGRALEDFSNRGLKSFESIKWDTVMYGIGALIALGGIAAAMGALFEVLVPGIAIMAGLGAALQIVGQGASVAAPAFDSVVNSLIKLKDIDIKTLLSIGPALGLIGTGLAVFSTGGVINSVLEGLGSLFGTKSPFDKIIELGKAAPNVTQIVDTLKQLDNINTNHAVESINNVNEALYNLIGTQKKAQQSGLQLSSIDNLVKNTSNSREEEGIKTLSINTVEHNKFVKSALIEQVKRQDTMIELLVQLVKKPSGGTTVNNNASPNVQPGNFRQDYSIQTLIA